MQYYPQPNSLTVLSTVKKRFFTTFFNLFSYLRLSPFKRDRISISANTIETSKIIHIDRNEENKIKNVVKNRFFTVDNTVNEFG
ncbi:unnamed protein product [Rotaria sordida]|uniref:Uncharacterized protein n=1 Tax=Rotaria sordida TaxID=392033 RepID=A0A820IES9_9BILA|nr:unnamed protein product [Rotaria sordida]